MKKFLFIAALFFGCLTTKIANAQVGFHVSVNIGSQPAWGPVGYSHAEYYYMPDIDAYYDVPAHQYVYFENNVWVHDGNLPPRYSNFDRYHSYKVVVNQRNPWERDADFRNRYAVYRGRRDQQIIRIAVMIVIVTIGMVMRATDMITATIMDNDAMITGIMVTAMTMVGMAVMIMAGMVAMTMVTTNY